MGRVLATIALLLIFTGCNPRDVAKVDGFLRGFSYRSGNLEKMRAFLEEQNILRRNSDGSINDKQTILAMVEWSRLNMAHSRTTDEANDRATDVMTLLQNHRSNGYVTVYGCWGATSVFKELLGSVNIKVIEETIRIAGGTHSRADFPALGRTTLHMDDVYMTDHSRRHDIPSIALLAPITILEAYIAGKEDGVEASRRHRAQIAETFLPDVYLKMRALIGLAASRDPKLDGRGGYGRYPTQEEVQAMDRKGAPGIYGISDTRVLRLMDAEIDRLGGMEAALRTFHDAIDSQKPNVDVHELRGFRRNYLPLPKNQVYREAE